MEITKSLDSLNTTVFSPNAVATLTQDSEYLTDNTWFRVGSLLHLLKIPFRPPNLELCG